MYLECFCLPGEEWEDRFLSSNVRTKRTCYRSYYPFGLFPPGQLEEMTFVPITILYGGNGSGKTTLLHVIARTLELERSARLNQSIFLDDFMGACHWKGKVVPEGSRLITSDDVFDYLLNIRMLNDQVSDKREELLREYTERRYANYSLHSMEDYEELKRFNDAKRFTGSKYVRENVMEEIPERSNEESAFLYFTEHIKENALYLLDEPENSMAVGFQLQLQTFLADSARFFGCQFIIATHSPFLLATPGAKIYDLDARPINVRTWTELENIRHYFDFFETHRLEFERKKAESDG